MSEGDSTSMEALVKMVVESAAEKYREKAAEENASEKSGEVPDADFSDAFSSAAASSVSPAAEPAEPSSEGQVDMPAEETVDTPVEKERRKIHPHVLWLLFLIVVNAVMIYFLIQLLSSRIHILTSFLQYLN